jgi:hypothetical protein
MFLLAQCGTRTILATSVTLLESERSVHSRRGQHPLLGVIRSEVTQLRAALATFTCQLST